MADTAFSGPVIAFGQSPIAGIEYNPDIGSSAFYAGAGVLDPRLPFTYIAGESQQAPDLIWQGLGAHTTISAVPYTAATGAIVASANPVSDTLVLVSSNSATTGVYIDTAFVRSDTGAVDSVVALDAYISCTAQFANGVMTVTANAGLPIGPGMMVLTAAGAVTQGAVAGTQIMGQLSTTGTYSTIGQGNTGTYATNGNLTAATGTVTLAYQTPLQCAIPTNLQSPSIWCWSPMALIGRVVAVFCATSSTRTIATVNGYDIYGYPMSEAITLTPNSAIKGLKAFKYIKSVVLSGGSADTTHAYRVDTTNVIGLPLRADTYGELVTNAGASQVTAPLITASVGANGFLCADSTIPSATTGDVRGTIDVSNASGVNLVFSTGTNKYWIRQTPTAYNYLTTAGLFGQPHYYNF